MSKMYTKMTIPRRIKYVLAHTDNIIQLCKCVTDSQIPTGWVKQTETHSTVGSTYVGRVVALRWFADLIIGSKFAQYTK